MNGIAAYYMWQKAEPVTYFRTRLPGFTVAFTNALLWTIVAIGYVVLASFAAAQLEHDPKNAGRLPRLRQREYWAGSLLSRHDVGAALCCIVFRAWFVKPTVAWTIWNLMLLFLGLSMPDPNFYGDRGQAG